MDTHDAGFRKRFARIAAQREAELREGFVRAGVDALELSTDGDLVDAVVRFTDMRKRRARLAAGGGFPAHLRQARPDPARTHAMNFLWPEFLWLLLALPLLVLLYVWLLRRKKKTALRYASLSIVQGGDGPRPDHPPPHSAGAVPAGAGRHAAGGGAAAWPW